MTTSTGVLTRPKQIGNTRLEQEYRDLLVHSRSFRLIPIDILIAESAADLRARWKLRTPDALQIATALDAGWQALLTNDHALRRVTDLQILVLDDLEL